MNKNSATVQQEEPFDRVAKIGQSNGLFRSCMQSIRSAHTTSNRLRAALGFAGLFTDLQIYREVIAIFYAVTKELESKIEKLKAKDAICAKLDSLGYHFKKGYEHDLRVLYGEQWKNEVDSVIKSNDVAREYVKTVQSFENGMQIAGAVFVLWGALIIGGGSAAAPRVKALAGPEATHLFQDVTGPGRENRKVHFAEVWDSLAEPGSTEFGEIVQYSKECMQRNNDVFSSLQRKPWWFGYLIAAFAALLGIVIAWLSKGWF